MSRQERPCSGKAARTRVLLLPAAAVALFYCWNNPKGKLSYSAMEILGHHETTRTGRMVTSGETISSVAVAGDGVPVPPEGIHFPAVARRKICQEPSDLHLQGSRVIKGTCRPCEGEGSGCGYGLGM